MHTLRPLQALRRNALQEAGRRRFARYFSSQTQDPDADSNWDPASDPHTLSEGARLLQDPTNRHLGDAYQTATGEQFIVSADRQFAEADWQEFERMFGLDKPISEADLDRWGASLKVEDVDADTIRKLGAETGIDGISIGVISDDVMPHHNTSPAYQIDDSIGEPRLASKRRSRRATGGATKKLSRRARELHLRTEPSGKEPQMGDDVFRQPVNKRQPGYERRAAKLEAEYDRLVADVLVERRSEWYSTGGDIHRVLLSPNLKNLTVYYAIDDDAHGISEKQWKQMNASMATLIQKEIFRRMDIRYVPNIFFERVKNDNHEEREAVSELDSLFEQITTEREEAARRAREQKPATKPA